MDTLYGFNHVPANARGAVIALGNFDGVHRGHQSLLAEVKKVADERRARSAVMAFEPHPREYFHPDKPHFRLTSLDQKLQLLEAFGIGMTVVLPFDRLLAALSAEDFVERVLVSGLGVGHVVIGYDFYFGKGRCGNAAFMRDAGSRFGFGISVVPPVAEEGEVFSSSGIRSALAQGDVRGAANALGYWWRIAGKVVGGAQIGTGIGFPTANVPMLRGSALAHGIYAVRVLIGKKTLLGAGYLGTRPTFDNGKPVFEVFLFDFTGDLYDKNIEIELVGFIRPDRKFDSVAELTAQMAEDCDSARRILADVGASDPMLKFEMARALATQRAE